MAHPPGDLFGEPQLVLHTAKDLAVCREVQRPARAWGHQQKGYTVREANGQEEIETPEGGRWIIRGRGSIYGYSASLAAVDEAWKVSPEVVEDGLEPTMTERSSSQIGLVSTAHRFATGLMQSRRGTAIEQLDDPRDTLLLEWSAAATADIDDRSAWRQASPHWSDRRERLVESQHRRAVEGAPPADPDEPDPLASFRSQWLNIWPPRVVASDGRGEPLLPEGSGRPSPRSGSCRRASSCSASRTGSARARPLPPRAGCPTAGCSRGDDPPAPLRGGRVLAPARREPRGQPPRGGCEPEHDPDCASIPVEARELAGQTDTRVALPLLRELAASGRLAHDGGQELTSRSRPHASSKPAPAASTRRLVPADRPPARRGVGAGGPGAPARARRGARDLLMRRADLYHGDCVEVMAGLDHRRSTRS